MLQGPIHLAQSLKTHVWVLFMSDFLCRTDQLAVGDITYVFVPLSTNAAMQNNKLSSGQHFYLGSGLATTNTVNLCHHHVLHNL